MKSISFSLFSLSSLWILSGFSSSLPSQRRSSSQTAVATPPPSLSPSFNLSQTLALGANMNLKLEGEEGREREKEVEVGGEKKGKGEKRGKRGKKEESPKGSLGGGGKERKKSRKDGERERREDEKESRKKGREKIEIFETTLALDEDPSVAFFSASSSSPSSFSSSSSSSSTSSSSSASSSTSSTSFSSSSSSSSSLSSSSPQKPLPFSAMSSSLTCTSLSPSAALSAASPSPTRQKRALSNELRSDTKSGKSSTERHALAIGRRGGGGPSPKSEQEKEEWKAERKRVLREMERAEECLVLTLSEIAVRLLSSLPPSLSSPLSSPLEALLLAHRPILMKIREKSKWWNPNRTEISDIITILGDTIPLLTKYANGFGGVMRHVESLRSESHCTDFFRTSLDSSLRSSLTFMLPNLSPLSPSLSLNLASLAPSQQYTLLLLLPLYHVWRINALCDSLIEFTPTFHPDFKKQTETISLLQSHLEPLKSVASQMYSLDLSACRSLDSDNVGKDHKWKESRFASHVWCAWCHGLILKKEKDSIAVTTCSECGASVHKRCRDKYPPHCGLFDQMKSEFSRQNRIYYQEVAAQYSLEFPEEEKGKGENDPEDEMVVPCRLLLFSDCVLCLTSAHPNTSKV